MALIGIDLGTTNSLACVYQKGEMILIPNQLKKYQTPSVVSFTERGLVVGEAAKGNLILSPKNTASSFKTFMGTNKVYSLGKQDFLPEELSAFVIKQIVSDAETFLNEPVTEAIISVPAYFNDSQRCATKLAAEMAGVHVERLINEPSAAALYYQMTYGKKDGCIMVIDFGGGTLDVSIVECFENIVEIIGIAGDNHLGGNDVDNEIAMFFCRQNNISLDNLSDEEKAILYKQAENAKITLSSNDIATMVLFAQNKEYRLILTNQLMAEICDDLLKRIKKNINQAVKNCSRRPVVDDVVLVGGSAQLKALQNYLSDLFGRQVHVSPNPEKAIALGIGVYAGIKLRDEEMQDIVMTDVCPFSLGVGARHSTQDQTVYMETMIPRSSMLPCAKEKMFYTLYDGQTALNFKIYQGEQYYVENNLELGEITVSVIPDKAGNQWAKVTFMYDINGILYVSVQSCTGEIKEKEIVNEKLHLSQEELEKTKEKLTTMIQSQLNLDENELIQRFVYLYQFASPMEKQQIGFAVSNLENAYVSGSPIVRKKTYENMKGLLKELEHHIFQEINFKDLLY
ncbi:Hsp70 family protein [Anaerotignum sp.]|uniref:Hsp70 family protein n=1 Tax=Anaerotignum sp. TaxID=2039241 RepID=UPI0027B8989B|nr:Hsp70 family protein [Anaerotignum sp.]